MGLPAARPPLVALAATIGTALGTALTLAPALAADPVASIDGDHPAGSVSSGPVGVSLDTVPDPGQPGSRIPRAVVTAGGQPVLTLTDAAATQEHPVATARLVEMDGSNDTPEVVLGAYTGGAHCCESVQVADKRPDGRWVAVPVDQFDGDADRVSDVDGDGRSEFETSDEAFLYTFDCYACSYVPLRIVAVRDGKAVDVTAEPQYLPRHKAWLAEQAAGARRSNTLATPGWVSGRFAMRLRAGEDPKAAWRDARAAARRYRFGPVDACLDLSLDCEPDTRTPHPFTAVLRELMKERGYAF